MKNYLRFGFLALAMTLYSCGGGESTPHASSDAPANPNNPNSAVSNVGSASTDEAKTDLKPSERVDMSTKGVGPITSVDIDLNGPIDEAMAAKGKEVYDMNCTACHHPYDKFVGPPQEGVLERRTPEWVMNMIMDPEGMVQNDPLAKELLIEFNGSPMSNQGITEEEARAL